MSSPEPETPDALATLEARHATERDARHRAETDLKHLQGGFGQLSRMFDAALDRRDETQRQLADAHALLERVADPVDGRLLEDIDRLLDARLEREAPRPYLDTRLDSRLSPSLEKAGLDPDRVVDARCQRCAQRLDASSDRDAYHSALLSMALIPKPPS
jgi:hypothetical protein